MARYLRRIEVELLACKLLVIVLAGLVDPIDANDQEGKEADNDEAVVEHHAFGGFGFGRYKGGERARPNETIEENRTAHEGVEINIERRKVRRARALEH